MVLMMNAGNRSTFIELVLLGSLLPATQQHVILIVEGSLARVFELLLSIPHSCLMQHLLGLGASLSVAHIQ